MQGGDDSPDYGDLGFGNFSSSQPWRSSPTPSKPDMESTIAFHWIAVASTPSNTFTTISLMDCCSINIRHPLVLVLAAMLIDFAPCDDHDSKEREECAESVVGLATCLPYVGGTAKSPTPDCCSGLKQVLNTSKKCVCVIIQDRNDPDLGLNINLTLALGLPQACNAPANISQCPALLGLAPDSPDAQIFYESGNGTHVAEGPNDNVKPAAPTDITTPGSIVEQQNDDDDSASANGKGFIGLIIFAGVLFLWSLDFVI